MGLKRRRIVCAGEAMIELAPHQAGWDVGYGGDTLNTAMHLVRLGHDVAYFTALGRDPFAGRMRAAWGKEGLDTSPILVHPSRNTGLYSIEVDRHGERIFHYWRGESAAREVFACEGADRAQDLVRAADLFLFSLISLAILDDMGRRRMIGLAQEVREAGGRVAFDGNYRPRLWQSREEAAQWRDTAASYADFGLPSLSDEQALGQLADAEAVAAHWQGLGCGEVVVKLGERGCRLPDGTIQRAPVRTIPVDTSGAGDAFNAGYLAARLRDRPAGEAALLAQALAAWVVLRPGAIPPIDHAAPYSQWPTAEPEDYR